MTHVDAIHALVEQYVTDQVAAVQAVADDFQAQLTEADAQVVALTAQIATLEAQGSTDAATIADLRQQLADCQAGTVDPPPDPEPSTFAGQPAPGTMYWGSTFGRVGGLNESAILACERDEYKGTASVKRSYFNPDQVQYMADRCSLDVAAGRLPWVSIKPPGSWAAVAAGNNDAWLESINTALAAVSGPVWFTLHHEPEDDDVTADFKPSQARMLARVTAPNVARSPILYAPNPNFKINGQPAYSDVDTWIGQPGELDYDFLGFDNYLGNKRTVQYDWTDGFLDQLHIVRDAYGLGYAIGETACKQSTDDAHRGWIVRAFNDLLADGCHGVVYFDSIANSVADWRLTGNRLADFAVCLARPQVARI